MSQHGPFSEAEHGYLAEDAIISEPIFEVTYPVSVTKDHPTFIGIEKQNAKARQKKENWSILQQEAQGANIRTQASRDIGRSFDVCLPGKKSIAVPIPSKDPGEPDEIITFNLEPPMGQLTWTPVAPVAPVGMTKDEIEAFYKEFYADPRHSRWELAPYVVKFLTKTFKNAFDIEKISGITQGHAADPQDLLRTCFAFNDSSGQKKPVNTDEGNFSKFAMVFAEGEDPKLIQHNLQYLINDGQNYFYRDISGDLVKIPENEGPVFLLAYFNARDNQVKEQQDPNHRNNLDALKAQSATMLDSDKLRIRLDNGKTIDLYPITSITEAVTYTASTSEVTPEPDKHEIVVRSYTDGIQCVDPLRNLAVKRFENKDLINILPKIFDNPSKANLEAFRTILKRGDLPNRDIHFIISQIMKAPSKKQAQFLKLIHTQLSLTQKELKGTKISSQDESLIKKHQEKVEQRIARIELLTDKMKNDIPLLNFIKAELSYQRQKGNPDSEKVYALEEIQKQLIAQMNTGTRLSFLKAVKDAHQGASKPGNFTFGIEMLLQSRRFRGNVDKEMVQRMKDEAPKFHKDYGKADKRLVVKEAEPGVGMVKGKFDWQAAIKDLSGIVAPKKGILTGYQAMRAIEQAERRAGLQSSAPLDRPKDKGKRP